MTSDQNLNAGLVEMLREALDRPIAFHRVFVKLTGSITAALMLSQAMYWSKRIKSDQEGWFFKTIEQWEEETGLTRREQECARKSLRRFSFWKEELRGVPAKMYYHADITALSNELLRLSGAKRNEKSNEITRLHESAKLDCTKAPNLNGGNVQTGMAETAKHNKGISETTTETIKTTPLTPQELGPDSAVNAGGRDFVEKLLVGTVLQGADPGRIAKAAKKYARSLDELGKAIDILDLQYSQSARKIDDSTALIVSALKDGIDPPEGYVSKAQRQAETEQRRDSAKKKTDEDLREKELEEQAFREGEKKLSELSEKEREEIFAKAKTKLPAGLRNSPMAVKSEAIRMLIADARAPD